MSRSSRDVCGSSMSPTTTRLLDPTGLDFHIEAGFLIFLIFFSLCPIPPEFLGILLYSTFAYVVS